MKEYMAEAFLLAIAILVGSCNVCVSIDSAVTRLESRK